MGLFSRNDDKSNDNYMDEVKLPGKSDIDDIFLEPDDEDDDLSLPSSLGNTDSTKPTNVKSGKYDIEDAISLMRDLPRDTPEIVVTVVKKTLESTKIHVSDIISDAQAKEERLRAQNNKLEDEIAKLETQIADRKNQISNLMDDLKETSEVKELLQLAEKLNKPAETPKKPEPSKPANKKADKPTGNKASALAGGASNSNSTKKEAGISAAKPNQKAS